MSEGCALAIRHWHEGSTARALHQRGKKKRAKKHARIARELQSQPCSSLDRALQSQLSLEKARNNPPCEAELWLDKSTWLLDWARWVVPKGGPEEGVEHMKRHAVALHRIWQGRSLPFGEASALDIYGAGSVRRAWNAHWQGSSVHAGTLIVSLLEQYVKLSLQSYVWTEQRRRAPNRLSLLCEDERFVRHFSPERRFWFSVLFVPSCLNLRNYFWHGFADDDFPPEYTTLLFVFALSWIAASGGDPHSSKIVQAAATDWVKWQQRCHAPLVYLPPPAVEMFEKEDEASFFLPPGRRRLTTWALRHYEKGEWDLWLCAILPLFEHAGRRAWVVASGAEAASVLAAREGELMTTLESFLTDPCRDLEDSLGADNIAFAQDLFLCREGPRVRDRIAHGAADANAIPPTILNAVAHLWLRVSRHCRIDGGLSVLIPYKSPWSNQDILLLRIERTNDLLKPLLVGDVDEHIQRASLLLVEKWEGRACFACVQRTDKSDPTLRFALHTLEALLSVAMKLLAPHNAYFHGARPAVAHCLRAVCAGLLVCAKESTASSMPWLQVVWRVLGTMKARLHPSLKPHLLVAGLAHWLQVPDPNDPPLILSYRERHMLEQGLASLP